MLIILCIFTAIHLLFFIWITNNWKHIPLENPTGKVREALTIIIPVRNEEGHIKNIIESLEKQNYPLELFKLFFVDDHSTDRTVDEIVKYSATSKLHIELLKLPITEKGKKAATTLGVKKTDVELIVCTDADCIHREDWLSSIAGGMVENRANMLSAPVQIETSNNFSRLQALEFSGLIGYGAITLVKGIPGMCNGANMAFRKSAFHEVNGYEGNAHIPTGDDEFLLQKISRKYPDSTYFLKSKKAIVRTSAKETFAELWSQRIRWTSKWRFHESNYIKISAILTFLDFLIGIIGIPYLVVTGMWEWSLIFAIRWVFEWRYLRSTAVFFDLKAGAINYLTLSIFYPVYAVVLGITSIFGRYSWKDRNYK